MNANNPTQNKVEITGYIGATPQLRDMGNGEYVASIAVYTKRSWPSSRTRSRTNRGRCDGGRKSTRR